ncbi:MAG: D-2-hydroxyacid dehydrogenase [Bacteroidaceae bacterium]|nr:D-2-hydroxyacid dehydrogenase [Bacteroidaceae bacterium]
MKIVILDGYTVNPGDLSWHPLHTMADLAVYDRTTPDEVVERCKGAEIVLTNKVVLDAGILNQLPHLTYIGVLATGYNVVDLKVATRQSITVTNIPAYSTNSVAQMVWAHILNITNRVGHYAEENAKGRWTNSKDFCYYDFTHNELAGKTMGIVGMGNTGMATARIAQAFGMNVIAYTSKDKLPEGMEKASLDEVFKESDIVSLHCPLTKETQGLVNKERLDMMKPSAILINTSRGPVINETDVAAALNEGKIAAFGADVVSIEPSRKDNPLLTAKNCFLTPHIAWATKEARQRLIDICIENVKAFLNDKPQNVVNG